MEKPPPRPPSSPFDGNRSSHHRPVRNWGRRYRAGVVAILAMSVAALLFIGGFGLYAHSSDDSPTSVAPQTPAPTAGRESGHSFQAHGGFELQTPRPSGQQKQRDQLNGSNGPAEAVSGGPVKHVTIPQAGPQHYRLSRSAARPASRRGQLITYNVRIERGLPYHRHQVAKFIHRVLNDRRSWGGHGNWRLERVKPGVKADINVYLVTPKTTDKLCDPLETEGKVSCFNEGKVVLNAKRWARGAESYGSDVINYRRNLVNHEFGHALGHRHVKCPAKGKRAPIMMQQTKGLHGCRANPWPYPKA